MEKKFSLEAVRLFKLRFYLNLKLQLKENRFKRFAQDIITKEPLNSERVEPYSRKEWLRYKNLHFCFQVFSK